MKLEESPAIKQVDHHGKVTTVLALVTRLVGYHLVA